MSYSVMNNCFKCKEYPGNGGTCTDGQKLSEGINKMYENAITHKGSGIILLSCCNLDQKK